MKRERRHFDREFKQMAVNLCLTGKSVREVADELGIRDECREAKGISQNEVAKLLGTNHSIIGKYERDEVKPTVDVVKKLAETLDTTVGYLLGETQDQNILKDQEMLKRLNDIAAFSSEEKAHILFALDAMITKVKLKTL